MQRWFERLKMARPWMIGVAMGMVALLGATAPALAWNYTVQQGNTYWGLSRRFGVSVNALESANPSRSAWDLVPGAVLWVPSGAAVNGGSNGTSSQASISPQPVGGFSAYDIQLMAQAATAEEGNRSLTDQVGVVDVILNRLHTPGFPKTVAGVIFAPGAFTSVANGYFYNVSPTDTSLDAVRQALAGWDPTHGALYFYDPGPGITDAWIYTQPVTVTIDGTVYAR